MRENKLIKNRIWMVALIVIIAGISAGLLTAVNLLTRQRIAYNEEIKLKKSVLDVFAIDYENADIIDIFKQKIKISRIGDKEFYQHYEQGRDFGIAFEIKGAGFWGPISSLVALEPGLRQIKGIEILRQEETPGLGGRIAEAGFKEQFKGRAVDPEIAVDAITGATMTSRAFKRIINENVKDFREEFKKR